MARRLFRDVLEAIRPSPQEMEEELAFADMLVGHISKHAPEGCVVTLTGSVAKRTFLRDKRDLDIFVLFPLSFPRDRMEPAIKAIMESAFPGDGYQLSYAEHPYARFHHMGRRIDLVPAYRISDSSQRMSAVDRSVLHTAFVLEMLDERQRDDVLLLKQLLKAHSLYGAEIKTQGFSGYLCELLIIRYKGFEALVKAASGWKQPVFIDIMRHYRKKEMAEAQELFGHLAVIDPTDKGRNVAAAVSPGSFRRFIALCRRLRKKPSPSMLLREPETFDHRLEKAARGHHVFLASMPRPDVVDDVLWGQLRRLMKQLESHLKGFRPKEVFAEDTRHIVRIAVVLREEELPPTELVPGPPLSMKRHCAQFRKAHKKTVKRDGKLYAERKRAVRKAGSAIKRFFKEFQSNKSHLAYPEEMVILERIHSG